MSRTTTQQIQSGTSRKTLTMWIRAVDRQVAELNGSAGDVCDRQYNDRCHTCPAEARVRPARWYGVVRKNDEAEASAGSLR